MNYPPGVTGFEPEIAGADERTLTLEVGCGACGVTGEVTGTWYIWDSWSGEFDWECVCGHENSKDYAPEQHYD